MTESIEFTLPRHIFTVANKYRNRAENLFSVKIQFEREVSSDIERWVTIRGRRNRCRSAQEYLISACQPDGHQLFSLPPRFCKVLLTDQNRIYIERESKAVVSVLYNEAKVEITGTNLAITMAVSKLEELSDASKRDDFTYSVDDDVDAKLKEVLEGKGIDYKDYKDFSVPVKQVFLDWHTDRESSPIEHNSVVGRSILENFSSKHDDSTESETDKVEIFKDIGRSNGYLDTEIEKCLDTFGTLLEPDEFLEVLRNSRQQSDSPFADNTKNTTSGPLQFSCKEVFKGDEMDIQEQKKDSVATIPPKSSGSFTETVSNLSKNNQHFNEYFNDFVSSTTTDKCTTEELLQQNRERRAKLEKALENQTAEPVTSSQKRHKHSSNDSDVEVEMEILQVTKVPKKFGAGSKKPQFIDNRPKFNPPKPTLQNSSTNASLPRAETLPEFIPLSKPQGASEQLTRRPKGNFFSRPTMEERGPSQLQSSRAQSHRLHASRQNGFDEAAAASTVVPAEESSFRLPDKGIYPPPGRLCRHIVLDGSNIAFGHGGNRPRNPVFSCRGIQLAVDHFVAKGHKTITVFLPHFRKSLSAPRNHIVKDHHLLEELEDAGYMKWTPSRKIYGQGTISSYDDRFIVKLAIQADGVIVSNDNFRDLQAESVEFRDFIAQRLLMFNFVEDIFMLADDPLGKNGPSLEMFLTRKATPAEIKEKKQDQLTPRKDQLTWQQKELKENQNDQSHPPPPKAIGFPFPEPLLPLPYAAPAMPTHGQARPPPTSRFGPPLMQPRVPPQPLLALTAYPHQQSIPTNVVQPSRVPQPQSSSKSSAAASDLPPTTASDQLSKGQKKRLKKKLQKEVVAEKKKTRTLNEDLQLFRALQSIFPGRDADIRRVINDNPEEHSPINADYLNIEEEDEQSRAACA